MSKLHWLVGRAPHHHIDVLLALLTGPDRHYHGIDHVEALWGRHLVHGGRVDDDIAAFAIAYHDAIYDARRQDNEQRSLELWLEHSEEVDRDQGLVSAVGEAIMATAMHPFQGDAPAHVLWMVDLDLLGLADAEAFASDTAKVAKEFDWVSPEDFVANRKKFFARLLEVPALYRTPDLHQLYEQKARANLHAAIAA